MEEFNPEACRLRHEHDSQRIGKLEATLEEIFNQLKEFGQRPSWIVLGIISFLSSGLGITITILLNSAVSIK